MSVEIAPLEMLVMDTVVEGKQGLITAFCRTYQAKVEPSDALLMLVQCESAEPGVVVVKVFTNSPHLPRGSFRWP